METLGAAKENSKIDALFWMIMGAFGVSTTTFVGQNYGARKYDRVRKSVRVCLALSLAATLLISAVLLLLGPMCSACLQRTPAWSAITA